MSVCDGCDMTHDEADLLWFAGRTRLLAVCSECCVDLMLDGVEVPF